MFSYTDDAIVTSSPTGRHLSTVIRRPAAIGPLDWSEHAEQVCKVLNELDRTANASGLQYGLSQNDTLLGRTEFYPGTETAGSAAPKWEKIGPYLWKSPDMSGACDPEGAFCAEVGKIYQNSVTGDRWEKKSGTGNRGWVQITARVKSEWAQPFTVSPGTTLVIDGKDYAELIDSGYLAPSHRHMRAEATPRSPVETCILLDQRIAELEKQIDDATTKLCAAQMLLEKPIEVTADLGASLFYLPVGGTTTHNNRTFKRVE